MITGDGDFGCIVEFFKKHKVLHGVIVPDDKKCSLLLKNKNVSMFFLNNQYHKFAKNEKAPDADVSA